MKYSIAIVVFAATMAAAVPHTFERRRFGQEQAPGPIISAASALFKDGTDAGAMGGFAGASIGTVLGGADPCGIYDLGDQMMTFVQGKLTGADLAKYVDIVQNAIAVEKNFNPFGPDPRASICLDPSKPANEQLRGILPLVDPSLTGAAEANTKTAQNNAAIKSKAVNGVTQAQGKSIGQQLIDVIGFSDFQKSETVGAAGAGAGAGAGTGAGAGAGAGAGGGANGAATATPTAAPNTAPATEATATPAPTAAPAPDAVAGGEDAATVLARFEQNLAALKAACAADGGAAATAPATATGTPAATAPAPPAGTPAASTPAPAAGTPAATAPAPVAGTPAPTPGAQTAAATGAGDLFNETFENLAVGTPVSTTFTNDVSAGTGTLEVVQDGANKVLRMKTQGNGRAFINVAGLAPPGNSFFGRAKVRVVEYPTAPNFAHWIMVEATGTGVGSIRPLGGQFFQEQNGNFFGVGSDLGPTGDWTKFKQSAPAVNGQWQCLEFEMNNADSRIAVSIDGVENPELTVSKNDHGGPDQTVDFIFPQFNNVKFGWQLFQGGSTPGDFTVDMDDLALSTTRIAC